MKALILAGGEGRRLRPLTNDKPKPMLEIAGKPIIEWQIRWMKSYGISSFVVLAGYMKEKLIDYLGTGAKLGVDISFEIEDEPLGTGGAIKNAEQSFKNEEKFVVANGDIITNFDLGKLISSSNNVSTISLVELRSTFGIVETSGNKVVGFREKPLIKDHWLNAGIYVMTKRVFDYLPKNGSVETVTFPKMAELGLLDAMKFSDVYWRSIDSFKDFEDCNEDLTKGSVYKN